MKKVKPNILAIGSLKLWLQNKIVKACRWSKILFYYPVEFRFKTCVTTVLLLSIALVACKKDPDNNKSNGLPYDPAIPVTVNQFFPDSGGIRTKFIVKGSNFGNDISKVSVYFLDEEYERKATVLGVDNETIYCLVPKQVGGNNIIKVKIEGDSVLPAQTFHYIVAQSVSNIVGVSGTAASTDGSLADARIQRTFGIAAVGNDEIISFEMLSRAVRYISVPDNRLLTLQTGFGAGQPAMTKKRDILYAIEYTSPHKVVRYKKESLWQPEILTSQIARPNGGAVVAGTIVSAALDDTEEWLYFRDRNGVFGRLEIANPSNVEILNETASLPGSNATTDYNYLIYSPVDDCFFFGISNLHTIYKMSKDGQHIEIYAGSRQGNTDGPREEALFNSPAGFNVDSEGNLYVMDSNNHCVRKINRRSGYVTKIAGTGVSGFANGEPLQSMFSYPYTICADEEDNYFIGESWGVTIRKLAIE